MKLSVTVFYSLLFAAVTGAYIYLKPEREIQKSEPAEPPSSMRLLAFGEEGPVVFIQIQNLEKGGTVSLRREPEGWMLKYPVVYRADPILAEGLVTALRAATKARRLQPQKDWDEYGLEKPSLKIAVETRHGPKRRTLALGDTSPVGDGLFARWEGEKEYFLLDPDMKKAFERTVYSLREKRVFRISSDTLTKIRVRTGDETYEWIREKETWLWRRPARLSKRPVDKTRSEEITSVLRGLFVKEFLDTPKAGLAFSQPGSKILIRLWGKRKQAETLCLGAEAPSYDAFTARFQDGRAILLIARGNVRSLFQAVETMAQEV